ncbi:MAG: D-alanyl-D-alanine carboxypeptidase family protein [Bacillota bacterium]|nr:D-alanyl-D-alanine carboxypeptidase [Bacillota bacterium]
MAVGDARKLILWLLLIVCTIPLLSVAAAPAFPAADGGPAVQAENAILMDVNSKRVLFEKNADEPKAIASITKIMTAILAIEYGRLDDLVVVSPKASRMEGSSIYLRPGERVTLETLLYGLMLRSGNDAAVAIAEHVAGTEENFVYLMNVKAWELGMTHTHFANPHGLDEEGHYSTARDMALLSAYALKNPVFQEIVKTKQKRVAWPGEQWERSWLNKNKMLHFYDGADGVKTGYTRKSGRTLVSSATRGQQQLVVVTLNDPDDWRDHMRLLDYGFSQYPDRLLLKEGQPVPIPAQWPATERTLEVAQTFYYPLAADEIEEIAAKVVFSPDARRRWTEGRSGDVVGQVHVVFRGKRIAELPVRIGERS